MPHPPSRHLARPLRHALQHSHRYRTENRFMSEVQASPPGLSATMGLEQVVDDDAASGRAVLHYRARPDHCHSGGKVQGGFVTGWIDAAMAHVVIARPNRELSPLSLEIQVSFMQSA